MSDYIEVIHPATMMCKVLCNGELLEEYKVEQCDRCSEIKRFDRGAYQKSNPVENILWFCAECK